MADIDTRARTSVVLAKERSEGLLPLVLERSRLSARAARREVEHAIFETVGVVGKIERVRRRMDAYLPIVLEQAATSTRSHRRAADRMMSETAERSIRSIDIAAERSQSMFREITGQGPQKTLRRGFAVVRSKAGEAVTSVTSVTTAYPGMIVQIDLHDGTVRAVVDTVTQTVKEGAFDTPHSDE